MKLDIWILILCEDDVSAVEYLAHIVNCVHHQNILELSLQLVHQVETVFVAFIVRLTLLLLVQLLLNVTNLHHVVIQDIVISLLFFDAEYELVHSK